MVNQKEENLKKYNDFKEEVLKMLSTEMCMTSLDVHKKMDGSEDFRTYYKNTVHNLLKMGTENLVVIDSSRKEGLQNFLIYDKNIVRH